MPQAIAVAAAWVATAIGTAAATIGITTSVTAGLAIYSASYAAATVALSVGAQVGLSALLSPKVGGGGMAGTQVDFQANPDAGVPYLIGRTGTAGIYVHATLGEAKNRNLLFATVFSGAGPVQSFDSFKAADETVTFSPLTEAASGGTYNLRMWQRRQLGAPSSASLQPPNTTDSRVFAEWTSAHKLSGLAASWQVLGYEQKVYATGAPAPMWVLKGVKVYDPRQDSTYPGGSGDHRVGNEATWTWSENPWLHALTWCLGRYQNGSQILGLGSSPAGIDMAAYVEAANIADANGWTIGGVVYSTDSKWQVLQAMAQAGGGKPIALGARVSCLVNAPRVSIATLTGADVDGEPTVTATQSRRERVNRVVARYRSEDHGWQIVPADPVTVSAYVAEDGEQRTREIEYPLVQSVNQAAQLAAYAIVNSREFGPVRLPLRPRWMGLKPGDCITVNEPEFGLNGQKLLVTSRERSPATGARVLTLVSETDAKHDFALGRTGTPPPTPGLSGVDITPPAPSVDIWVATAGPVDDHGSPTIVVTGACDDPNARWINVEYRWSGDTEWTTWPGGPPNSTRFEITGLKATTPYDVAISYTSVRDVIGARRVLSVITTGAIPAAPPPPPDTTPPGPPTDLTFDASLGTIFLGWSNPSDADLDHVEVWEGSVNIRTDPTTKRVLTPRTPPGGESSVSRTGLAAGVTRYYWLRAFDHTGNASDWSSDDTDGFPATTASLVIDDFASGIQPIGRGSTLPNPLTYDLDTFLLTTNGKIYRRISGAWVANVATTDLTGTLTDAQLAAISASKITGLIAGTQIGSNEISTGNLAANAVTSAKIAALQITTAKIAAGAVTASEIQSGSVSTSHLAASSVTTTQLAASSVVASKVSAGTLTADRLVVDQIDTQYIKSGAISNSGQVDLGTLTDINTTGGVYTNISGSGIYVECRNPSGGSYTTIQMVCYVEGINLDTANSVGLWVDVVASGPDSRVVGGSAVNVAPYNSAPLTVPIQFRTSAHGNVLLVVGAYAALAGGTTGYLKVSRCRLMPIAIFKS